MTLLLTPLQPSSLPDWLPSPTDPFKWVFCFLSSPALTHSHHSQDQGIVPPHFLSAEILGNCRPDLASHPENIRRFRSNKEERKIADSGKSSHNSYLLQGTVCCICCMCVLVFRARLTPPICPGDCELWREQNNIPNSSPRPTSTSRPTEPILFVPSDLSSALNESVNLGLQAFHRAAIILAELA